MLLLHKNYAVNTKLSNPRKYGAEVSKRHFGTSAEVSGHFRHAEVS